MRSFTNALAKSLEFGNFKRGDAEKVITLMLKIYNVWLYNDDSGSPWMEFYSKDSGELFALIHSIYKIAFIKSDIISENNFCHIENIESFGKQEWYIENFIEFKNTFVSIHWDEPEYVVDPSKFSLLDMKFATE